eukprot:973441-Pelagomonas_calceolata.AAC.5
MGTTGMGHCAARARGSMHGNPRMKMHQGHRAVRWVSSIMCTMGNKAKVMLAHAQHTVHGRKCVTTACMERSGGRET